MGGFTGKGLTNYTCLSHARSSLIYLPGKRGQLFAIGSLKPVVVAAKRSQPLAIGSLKPVVVAAKRSQHLAIGSLKSVVVVHFLAIMPGINWYGCFTT